jgi:membrane fusion protein, multidrug efflux system
MKKTSNHRAAGRSPGWRAAAAALTLALAAGCTKAPAAGGRDPRTGAEPATIFAVNITRAVEGMINDYIELNGDVETKSSIDIFADVSGKLSRLGIRVGDRVLKDQVIADVDPSRPGNVFIASPVKSPIEGTVTSIPNQVGATISPGVPLARITTTDQLQIRTAVAERFISRVRLGLDAVVSFEAFPEASLQARITEVSPVVDPASRTLEIKLVLVRPDPRVKAGMFARIKVVTERKAGVVKIPAEAVVRRFDQSYVFVISPSAESESGFVVERTRVVPGIQIDNELEILEGLKAGQDVVIQGQTLLEDKSKVRVVSTVRAIESDHEIR